MCEIIGDSLFQIDSSPEYEHSWKGSIAHQFSEWASLHLNTAGEGLLHIDSQSGSPCI